MQVLLQKRPEGAIACYIANLELDNFLLVTMCRTANILNLCELILPIYLSDIMKCRMNAMYADIIDLASISPNRL